MRAQRLADAAAPAALGPQLQRAEPAHVGRAVEHPAHDRLCLCTRVGQPVSTDLLQHHAVRVAPRSAPARPPARRASSPVAAQVLHAALQSLAHHGQAPDYFLAWLRWGIKTSGEICLTDMMPHNDAPRCRQGLCLPCTATLGVLLPMEYRQHGRRLFPLSA